MKTGTRKQDRLDRIAAQIARLEKTAVEWIPPDPVPVRLPEISLKAPTVRAVAPTRRLWEWMDFRGKLIQRIDQLKGLVTEMRDRAKDPFSMRTKQIAALSAFIPFFFCVVSAAIRFMPHMPELTFWAKITWFIFLPMIMAMAGAFVGFIIGVMLDSMERQADNPPLRRHIEETAEIPAGGSVSSGVKSSVWVAVDDLEPNQRVAETVVGPDGTPILLRHTLLKPSHIDILRRNNIDRVRVEVIKYPGEGDLAMAS